MRIVAAVLTLILTAFVPAASAQDRARTKEIVVGLGA